MTTNLLLIHGAWVTPLCWDNFASFFREQGLTVLAPAWPGKDRSVEEIRRDPSPLIGLGVNEIVEHYAGIIRSLPEPPILIGHSFGGLFTQILLDRGLGAAGVAIDSAPPRGILATQPSAFRSLGAVLANPANRNQVVRWDFEQFRYAFAHTLPAAQARAAYDQHITPETGRVFFQAALAQLDRRQPTAVNFANHDRPPLLLVAGEDDKIVPAALNRANHRRYRASRAVTDFVSFPGRTHWIIAQDGWQEVASHIHQWLTKVGALG